MKSCFSIDLASLLAVEFVQRSLVKDEEIELSKQIALNSSYIASKIDTHGRDHAREAVALPVLTIQYNVQTLKMEDDEIDLFSRFRSENCAIVCIQENRKRYNGIKDIYGYFRCMAAGTNGDHGVEVCIS